MNARRPHAFVLGIGLVLGLLAVDQVVFATWFGVDHLRWYLVMGASVSLVSSIVAIAWGDIERQPGLVSAHPLDYMGACMQLVGLSIHALGTHGRGTPVRRTGGELQVGAALDGLLAIPLVLLLVAAMLVWLVVIAPPQYFVHLLCGAPARRFARSARQPIARLQGTQLKVEDVAIGEKIPEGWWTGGLAQRPVATTSLFASLVLMLVRPLLA